MTTVPLRRLYRIRWAVRATLAFGVAASVAANVLHANPNPISQSISAWPPLALLLTVELVSRVPVHRRSLAALRMAATAVIAGIAGGCRTGTWPASPPATARPTPALTCCPSPWTG